MIHLIYACKLYLLSLQRNFNTNPEYLTFQYLDRYKCSELQSRYGADSSSNVYYSLLCCLRFCISPRPGHHRPTIGRAKQHDNAMRCALVSISSDGSDLQLLPASPFVQIRSEHSSNPAVNCSCSTNTCLLVHLWKLKKPPIKFMSSRLCLMSTDCRAVIFCMSWIVSRFESSIFIL